MDSQQRGHRITAITGIAFAFVLAVIGGILLRQHTAFGAQNLDRFPFRLVAWTILICYFALAAIPLARTVPGRPGGRVVFAFGSGIALTLWWALAMLVFNFLRG
jgi:hypothetical protein